MVKTADGQRITVRPGDIEDRKTSDVSLMPEGLAQTMSDQQLVDLLAYLSTLRKPVSIVGQYYVVGPLPDVGDGPVFDYADKRENGVYRLRRLLPTTEFRRLDANAEGQADLTPIFAGHEQSVVCVYIPLTSPIEQRAHLVVETRCGISVWAGDKQLIKAVPTPSASEPREVDLTLPRGKTSLAIRLGVGERPAGQSTLVTTIVSEQPVSFTRVESSPPAR